MPENSLSRRSVLARAAAGAAASALAVPLATAPARATSAPVAPGLSGKHRIPDEFTVTAPELYPEGIAWDPTRSAFLVGSARFGSVSVVTTRGKVTELVAPLAAASTLGIRVDAARNRALVAYSDFWVRQQIDTGLPPVSAVAVFALDTGKVLRRVDVDPGGARTFANDLTLDDDGNAYVTNSVTTRIMKVTPRGRISTLLDDPRFEAAVVGANGIVYDPRGYLLVARYDTGVLYRIPLERPRRMREVELEKPLIGTDGMILTDSGDLVVVTNAIGEAVGVGGGVDAVTVLSSHDRWRSAKVKRQVSPWPVAGPTTVTMTPRGAYVLSGRVGTLLSGSGVGQDFTVRRL
ncbi:hypothetical protein [Kineosporia succinea]|uniref:Sugar lactone lactonase YvrE n=1 Tax=Kineosporia succinea TaxID=84632 RepID=A0ABT9P6W7_9ACTN|nr:hypothetical protein [Kineosporia succinea]MDP9828431.1 sugar lactone lactonase YvrE [Kineosporia succinea]